MISASNNMIMLDKSMDFLWAKQAAHLDNISNAETPGYKVKTVTFEESFQARLEGANGVNKDPKEVRKAMRRAIEDSNWTVWEDEESTRMDENGVNVTEQFTELTRNAYQIQHVMQAINSELSRLNAAATGR